jgi:hypothetical protein
MPRLSSDPNLNICPDYAEEVYANARLQLTNQNIDEAQAIIILRNDGQGHSYQFHDPWL